MQQPVTCSRCGAANLPTNTLCGWCGAPLTRRTAPSSEQELPAWLYVPAEADAGTEHERGHAPTSGAAVAKDEKNEPAFELPAWLREGSEEAQPREPGASPWEESHPAWLDDPTEFPTPASGAPDAPQRSRTAPESARPAEHGYRDQAPALPAWLAELATSDQAPSEPSPTPAADLPPWLEGETEELPDVPDGATEVPDWLREVTEAAPANTPGASSEAPSAGALPAWLVADLVDGAEAPEGLAQANRPPMDEPGEAEADALPAWLRDDQVYWSDVGSEMQPSWLQAVGGVELPDEAQTGAAPVVMDEPAAMAPPEQLSTRNAVGEEPGSRGKRIARVYPVTDEMAAHRTHAARIYPIMTQAAQTDVGTTSQTESARNEAPGGLDLPAWLRDVEPAVPAARAATTTPAWLGGIDLNTAVAPVESAPARRTVPAFKRSPERIAAAELLQRLLVEPPPEPVFTPAVPRRARAAAIIQIVAFIILLLAILVVLLGPRLALGRAAGGSNTGAASITQRIAALKPGVPVLLAYEWDARRAAEMEPLEDVVIAQLTARKTPLILMTTDPQGALLSRRRVELLKERNDNFYNQAGLGFVDLGYKPGGIVALARASGNFGSLFERDWAGVDLRGPQHRSVIQTMCQSPNGNVADCRLDRVGMLVVMADEGDDARNWVEQVVSAHPAVPVTFVAPAEVAPLIQPYVARPNMAMIAGLADAAALGAPTGSANEPLMRRADANAVGAAVFGVLVLAGMGPALWSGRRARRYGKASVWDR